MNGKQYGSKWQDAGWEYRVSRSHAGTPGERE